jgi:glutathione peroxidase
MTTPLEQIPLRTIDGRETTLAEWSGKVRLVVNVASKCGLTPQYEALEAAARTYADRGLVILGFPSNDFLGQEPGTEEEIKTFCSSTYDVTFPLFAKIVVKGEGQHPLYAALTKAQPDARVRPGSGFRAELAGYGTRPDRGEVLWNFEKFLIDRSGNVVDRFEPDVTVDSELARTAIERALG